jgi:hypothetical protein
MLGLFVSSVADPGCFIPDPGSGSQKSSSRIPDPTVHKKRDEKKINPTCFLRLMVSGASLIIKN